MLITPLFSVIIEIHVPVQVCTPHSAWMGFCRGCGHYTYFTACSDQKDLVLGSWKYDYWMCLVLDEETESWSPRLRYVCTLSNLEDFWEGKWVSSLFSLDNRYKSAYIPPGTCYSQTFQQAWAFICDADLFTRPYNKGDQQCCNGMHTASSASKVIRIDYASRASAV